jgi:single-strand DNA-binding protein
MAIAKFSIAVDRRFQRGNSQDGNDTTADFFNCTAFGRQGEFVEKYLKQGTKIVLTGRVQNDNYTNKNGEKVYSVKVLVDEIEFAERKQQDGGNANTTTNDDDDFVQVDMNAAGDLPFFAKENN